MSKRVTLYRVDHRGHQVRLFEVGALERANTYKLDDREAHKAGLYSVIVRKDSMGDLCLTPKEAADVYALYRLAVVRSLESQLERANERLESAQEFSEQFSDRPQG